MRYLTLLLGFVIATNTIAADPEKPKEHRYQSKELFEKFRPKAPDTIYTLKLGARQEFSVTYPIHVKDIDAFESTCENLSLRVLFVQEEKQVRVVVRTAGTELKRVVAKGEVRWNIILVDGTMQGYIMRFDFE